MQAEGLLFLNIRLSIYFSKLKSLDLHLVEQSRGTEYVTTEELPIKPQIHVEKQQKPNKQVTESIDLSPTTDGLQNILDSSDDDDIFIWGLPSVGYCAEIQ